MSESELAALARDLGVEVCDDLNMLVYCILDAQASAYVREHKKQTRRKTSTKTGTKTGTKAKAKSKTEENRTNEEWAKTQLEKVQEETKPKDEKTRELLKDILTKWSCQWEVDENGAVSFTFQGGNFTARFNEDSPFVFVYYLGFYSVEAYQKEKVKRMKEVVNEMNCRSILKVVYSTDPDDGQSWVYAEAFFLLIPEIPYVEDYLKFYLRGFFRLHHDFESKMEEDEK